MQPVWVANGLLLVTAFAWGTTAPVFAELLRSWDPITLTALRFTLTAPLFLLWLRLAEGARPAAMDARAWREVLILGFLLVAFAVVLNIGIQLSDPVTAAVYSAAAPLVSALLDWLMNGRRPARGVVLGVPFAVSGGLLASVDPARLGEAALLSPGSPWLLFAAFLWPLYSMLLQRWLGGFSQLRRTAASFAASVPFAAAAAAAAVALSIGYEALPAEWPDGRGYTLIAWTVLGTSIVGTLCWNVGVSRIGISVASMFLNLIPVVAVVVSIAFGIVPTTTQLMGGALVMIGVALAQGWHRRLGDVRRQATRP